MISKEAMKLNVAREEAESVKNLTRKNFSCTQCGLCCQYVGAVSNTQFLDRGDGVCRHYDEPSRLCQIYETRPDICRVDKQYALNYASRYSWEEFSRMNEAACQQLQELPLRRMD